MIILGINAYHGDASAAVLVDGELVAAAEEERFNRVKHSAGFPSNAIIYCLSAAGASINDVDHIAIPRNSRARLFKKLLYAAKMPRFAVERFRAHGRFGSIGKTLAEALDVAPERVRGRFHRVEHHLAHLASSYFVSPFEQAALLSLDGLGDFASGMWGIGEGNRIRVMGSVGFPHSLGLYYTALSQYLGFWKYGDEYKVMGLAAYGEPEFRDEFRRIVQTDNEIGYSLDLRYFTHHNTGPTMTWEDGEPELGPLFSHYLEERLGPARSDAQPLEERHKAVAATLQNRLEEVTLHIQNALHRATNRASGSGRGSTNLAYAGGVAFNCVGNGKIFDQTPFQHLYIQPAAGDAGLAIGAAFYVWHQVLDQPRQFAMDHAYWGPEYSDGALRNILDSKGLRYREFQSYDELCEHAAGQIAEGKIVGWFQGRMEWGPRALGNRSIVVDPRRPDMKDILNARIKHREPFRPFSPSVLEERASQWFDGGPSSAFMLLAYPVRADKRSEIPAPTHVDGTGRLQTVSRATNPLYWSLIRAFEKHTGVPVLLNTSFNENEPIVNTPEEAIECFLRTKMDVLAMGPLLVERGD